MREKSPTCDMYQGENRKIRNYKKKYFYHQRRLGLVRTLVHIIGCDITSRMFGVGKDVALKFFLSVMVT